MQETTQSEEQKKTSDKKLREPQRPMKRKTTNNTQGDSHKDNS